MKTNVLAVRPKISPYEAEKMIWTFIRHGNHRHRDAMKGAPKRRIEEWFAENNEPLSKLVTQCRSYFEIIVPFVENCIGSTWTAISEGGGGVTVSLIKSGKDEPEMEVTAPGTIGVSYEAKFESACRARDKAIDSASLEELHTSIIKGIASIESYIAHRVEIWNRSIDANMQLNDKKNAKVSFEDKIKIWIPKMTGGVKLDIAGQMWADFLFLQGIRNGDAVHAKKFAQGTSFSDLALALNKVKTGIANFLLQLHILFDEPVPRVVIRARFFPEVYLQPNTK
ncbi:MAG: hypothetical protein HQK85_00330 [Nitrospinae bacterium]|nr:hypothetical protein [Nitrospinota bacterium]